MTSDDAMWSCLNLGQLHGLIEHHFCQKLRKKTSF